MGRLSFFKKKKYLLPIIVVLVFLALFIIGIKNLNSPAQGTVTQNNLDNVAKIASGPQQYSDTYITFTYPGSYSISPTDKQNSYLDIVNLVSKARRDQYAAISVVKENIDSDSGVNYRRLHPEMYKSVSSSSNQLIFVKDDQTEYTGYLQKGNYTVTISFTSVAASDMSADYQVVANSIKLNR